MSVSRIISLSYSQIFQKKNMNNMLYEEKHLDIPQFWVQPPVLLQSWPHPFGFLLGHLLFVETSSVGNQNWRSDFVSSPTSSLLSRSKEGEAHNQTWHEGKHPAPKSTNWYLYVLVLQPICNNPTAGLCQALFVRLFCWRMNFSISQSNFLNSPHIWIA